MLCAVCAALVAPQAAEGEREANRDERDLRLERHPQRSGERLERLARSTELGEAHTGSPTLLEGV